jgi:hypothetical protein
LTRNPQVLLFSVLVKLLEEGGKPHWLGRIVLSGMSLLSASGILCRVAAVTFVCRTDFCSFSDSCLFPHRGRAIVLNALETANVGEQQGLATKRGIQAGRPSGERQIRRSATAQQLGAHGN